MAKPDRGRGEGRARPFRDRPRGVRPGTKKAPALPQERVRLYGLHAVDAALANPARHHHSLHVTANARGRLASPLPAGLSVTECDAKALDALVGADAVHQGVVLETDRLDRIDGSELFRLADARLVLALDQVTDPHNVGAILRSAVAMAADAVMVTARDAAPESGVLAKSASGALEMIPIVAPRNLSAALAECRDMGFAVIGLDSDGPADMADTLPGDGAPILLVLGAEGRGLRQKTRETCTALARLDMPGPIRSLNVSNAAALSLYLARRALTDGLGR